MFFLFCAFTLQTANAQTSTTTVSCSTSDQGLFNTLSQPNWNPFNWVLFGPGSIELIGGVYEVQIDPELLGEEVRLTTVSWVAPQDGILRFDFDLSALDEYECFVARILVNSVQEGFFFNGEIPLDAGDEIIFGLYWLTEVSCLGEISITVDSISFEYECPSGCLYPQALNYNPEASVDNGSCQFESVVCIPTPDLNGDGVVNTIDLMIMLAFFGDIIE